MKVSQRTKFLVYITIVGIVVGFIIWVLNFTHPKWFPNWLDTLFIIIAGLGVLLSALGSVVADLLLPLLERTSDKSNDKIQDLLRRNAPIRKVTYDELVGRLGKSGTIPWIDRNITSTHLLLQNDRIAIIGPMKSGKTREAIELIRRAQEDGIISSVYEPTSSLDLIELDVLRETVALQIERHAFLFFVDELCLRQSTEDLERLSMCIDAICDIRPYAHILVTLQEERLFSALEQWLTTNHFESIRMIALTHEQRRILTQTGRRILEVALTDDAARVLSDSEQVAKPWDVVSALQSAPQLSTGAPALDAEQVRSLLSRSQESIWKGQRQEVIGAQPAAAYLLDAIAVFLSAGVTPREDSIRRFAEFRIPSTLSRSLKQQELDDAVERWRRFDIVAVNGLYTIPEPRLLPIMNSIEDARNQLHIFLKNYRPNFLTQLIITSDQFFGVISKFSWPMQSYFSLRKSQLFIRNHGSIKKLKSFFLFIKEKLPNWNYSRFNLSNYFLFELPPYLLWNANRALLVQELGGVGLRSAYLSSSLFLLRGREHFNNQDYTASLAELNRAVALYPNNTRALAQRGLTYKQMKQYEAAVADLTRAIELDPKYDWALAQRGVTYRQMEQYELAVADLTRAIELDSKDEWVFAQRGVTYSQMKQYEAAVTDLTCAIELDPMYDWALAQRGVTYRQMEQYELAVADLTRAIELDSKDEWVFAQRGVTYSQMEQYELAVADLTRAIELDSKDEWVFALRGVTYSQMEQYEAAVADLTRSIELDSKDEWVFAQRGVTYRQMEQYELAVADLTRAIELDSKNEWVFAQRGVTYSQMEQYEAAVADLTRAIELDPKDEWVFVHRGVTYQSMEQYEAAVADFSRAIELDPKDGWVVAERGATYRLMKQYDAAILDLNRAIELEQDGARLTALRGFIYAQMEQYDAAAVDLSQAIKSDPTRDWLLYMFSLVLAKQSNTHQSNLHLANAIQIAEEKQVNKPQNWRIASNLALYYLASGNVEMSHKLCKLATGQRVPLGIMHEFIQDITDYLHFFPEHEEATKIRKTMKIIYAQRKNTIIEPRN